MKKNYTHITAVLDRSGSMFSTATDAAGGFNTFIAEQKKLEGELTVSIFQFDDKFETVCRLNVNPPVWDCVARGNTALHDAIGKAITLTGEDLASLKEEDRPDQVYVVIVTDGLENYSTDWTGDRVKDLIEHQRDRYNWQFVFLSAGEDAVTKGMSLGIAGASSLTYANTAAGNRGAYASVTRGITTARMSKGGPVVIQPADDEDFVKFV